MLHTTAQLKAIHSGEFKALVESVLYVGQEGRPLAPIAHHSMQV